MNCLTHGQLASLALGQVDDARLAAHVETCPDCRAEFVAVSSLVGNLKDAHAALNENHDVSRTRLLDELSRSAPVEPVKPAESAPAIFRRTTNWLGELNMRQRIALLTVGLVPALAFLVIWIATSSSRAIAMEDVAAGIRDAKSYRLTLVQEITFVPAPGMEAETHTLKMEQLWRRPGSFRSEMARAVGEVRQKVTNITFRDKPGIEIDHTSKTWSRVPPQQGHRSPTTVLQKLSTFRGRADRELGTKKIGKAQAIGFELDAKRMDPDAYKGPVEIWIDPDSRLPLLIEMTLQTSGMDVQLRFENIRWNVELDPKLFDPTPPEGYADKTRKTPPVDEQIEQITSSLKTYAEFSDGKYPQVKMVYGDVTRDDLRKKMGFEGVPTIKQRSSKEYGRILEATRGFAQINIILRENADAAWYGQTVTAKDGDKLLFYWKLPSGEYQVIYGDLKSTKISAAQLRELKTK